MLIEKKEVDVHFGMILDQILFHVLKNYGFDDSWIVLPFINANKKPVAFNRRSETARKAVILYKNELYILKEIPWYCSSEDFVKYEMNFQQILRNENIIIPEIITNLEGNLYTKIKLFNQEKFFFLQKYIQGKSWDETESKLISAAENLAKLHKCSMKNSKKIIKEFKPPKSTVFDLADRMLNVLEQGKLNKRNSTDYKKNEIIQKFCNECKRKNISAKKWAIENGYSQLAIPVHGDYNPWNIIFDAYYNEVVGIIDFDNSIIDNTVHDVVEAILDFCLFTYKDQRTIFENVPTKFNKSYAKLFLKTYIEEYGKEFMNTFPYISQVALSIAIELISLGLERGDYKYMECNELLEIIDLCPKFMTEIVEEIKNDY